VRVQRLEVKADAMASFVQKQAHQQWGGMALDATTRQLIALPVGARRPTQTVPSLPLLWWGVRATLPCKPQVNE
jgi:IS1 family transposase